VVLKQCRHWNRGFTDLKQTQNVEFLYQANVKRQIGYKYQRQLFRTNQYFIVDIFPRVKSCFVKLKIVSMAGRIKRKRTHRFSDIAHISRRISITLHWTLIFTLFFFEERFEVLFFSQPEKGQLVPRSNIDNRLQQVSLGKTSIGVDLFPPLCRFPALLYAGNLFNRFDMSLIEE